MTKTTFHFDGGKYAIVRDDTTFATEAFRHGEPWDRSFVGDKLFHAMLNRIEAMDNALNTIYTLSSEGYISEIAQEALNTSS